MQSCDFFRPSTHLLGFISKLSMDPPWNHKKTGINRDVLVKKISFFRNMNPKFDCYIIWNFPYEIY